MVCMTLFSHILVKSILQNNNIEMLHVCVVYYQFLQNVLLSVEKNKYIMYVQFFYHNTQVLSTNFIRKKDQTVYIYHKHLALSNIKF